MRILKTTILTTILLSTQFLNAIAQNKIGFKEIKKLYYDNNFSQILNVIDPLIAIYDQNYKIGTADFNGTADLSDIYQGYTGGTIVAISLSDLYSIRAGSRFGALYQSRTGVIFDSTAIFDENRPRFELKYEDKAIQLLDGAINDLNLAMQIGSSYTFSKQEDRRIFQWFQNAEENIRKLSALTYLEKAQFVTNSYIDFRMAKDGFSGLESSYEASDNVGLLSSANPDNLKKDYTRMKSNGMLAAELCTQIALGETDKALLLFNKWVERKGISEIKNAIPAMVEAFDMVGNYKSTEGFLVREAVRQITTDKGQVIPANFLALKAAMKLHLANVNFAIGIPADGKLLSLKRARLSGAYNFKGNLTAAESSFIKNAPGVIIADKNTPPLNVQLNAVMLKLQSTDKKEIDAATKLLEDMLKKDATNAAILSVSGYAKMLRQDVAGAETDLSAALKKDAFLAFTYSSFENRALVYKKLGKTDMAAKDEADHNKFKQLLAFLAAP